jgi:hypothetical protein
MGDGRLVVHFPINILVSDMLSHQIRNGTVRRPPDRIP